MISFYTLFETVSPSKKEFIQNLENKLQDKEFNGDVFGLLRPEVEYDVWTAYEFLKNVLFDKL